MGASAAAVQARHAEVARRYAWQALQRRKRDTDAAPDKVRLITLIRLRELERLFRSRYGRFLPDDDAGRDDVEIAAHHIAFLRGDVEDHIVAWAHANAPSMTQRDARALARRVMAKPQKFTADTLAWRLRLTMAERMALKITTIGAFDISREQRAADLKRRRREAARAKRAANSSGRPRGRPRKAAGTAENKCVTGREDTIACHAFSTRCDQPCAGDVIGAARQGRRSRAPVAAPGTTAATRALLRTPDGGQRVSRPPPTPSTTPKEKKISTAEPAAHTASAYLRRAKLRPCGDSAATLTYIEFHVA